MIVSKFVTDKYVKSGGEYCPNCGGGIIGAISDFDSSYNQVYRNIQCSECKYIWRDIYTLTDAEEV